MLSVQGKQRGSERTRQELNAYHDQFINHVETSLSHLNETLHKWRHHEGTSRAHAYLSQATKHSVEALTRLEDIVTSHEEGGSTTTRRALKQIYDDTSKAEADKRLDDAKRRAEAKFKNAIGLLQEAAQKAAQNTSAELLDQLNARIEGRNLVSSGKILSEELQTVQMASKLFDLTKGLFPVGESDDSPLPSPAKAEEPSTSPPMAEGVSNQAPLAENLTPFDFYKEKSAVFDRFDDTLPAVPQGSEGPLMRRRLSEASNADKKQEIIKNVEASLEAIRSLRESHLALTKESVENIRKAAEHSRSSYAKLVQESVNKSSRRRLYQDTVIDSGDSDAEEFLTFPGESYSDDLSRLAAKSPDEVIDYEDPVILETTTIYLIPVSNTTDAEELIDQIVRIIMASMAEAAVPVDLGMFDAYPPATNPDMPPEMEHNASWMPYYEKTSAVKRRRRLNSMMGQDISNHGLEFDDSYDLTVYVYDPVWFRDAQDKKILSSFGNEEDQYSLTGDDDSFQISMAIRMSSPEEFGGLSDEMIQFLGLEDVSTIENMYQKIINSEWDTGRNVDQFMLPRYSLFNYPPKALLDGIVSAPENHHTVKQESNEGLADIIVQKLQNSLYRPSDGTMSNSVTIDLRWFGVMFGVVGIVMMIVMGAITAFRRGSSGYHILEEREVNAVSPIARPAQQPASKPRKVSNLPA